MPNTFWWLLNFERYVHVYLSFRCIFPICFCHLNNHPSILWTILYPSPDDGYYNRNVNVDFTSWYIHLFGLYFFLLPSYIYIYCDEEMWHPNTFGCQRTMVAGINQRTIVVNRIMEVGRETISPSTLSIIKSWNRHETTSLPISYVCVSGEANPRPYLVPKKSPPKKNHHMVNVQTTENKFVADHSTPGEDVIWDTEETQIPK